MRFSLRTLLLVVFIVAVVFGIWRLLPERREWRLVRRGMTPDQVEAILGKPELVMGNTESDRVNWFYGYGYTGYASFRWGKVEWAESED